MVSGIRLVEMAFYWSCSPHTTLQKSSLMILDHIPNSLKEVGLECLDDAYVFLFEVNERSLHISGGKRAQKFC